MKTKAREVRLDASDDSGDTAKDVVAADGPITIGNDIATPILACKQLINERVRNKIDSVYVNAEPDNQSGLLVSRVIAALRPGCSLYVPADKVDPFGNVALLYVGRDDERTTDEWIAYTKR